MTNKHNIPLYKEIYDKHMNLKIAAKELNIKWQTLYWHLSKEGHPVLGDKKRYGSDTDKLAEYTESLFQALVPSAKNNNEDKFQSKCDFTLKGLVIDIKASTKKDGYKNNTRKNAAFRWAFSCRVQEKCADFLVCFCFSGYDCIEYGRVEKILLLPKEVYKNMQSISMSCRKSKWEDYVISEDELVEFFDMF